VSTDLRHDLRLIADMVAPGSRVLDIGCGDGALLAHLAAEKGVDARGVELSQAGVNACVRGGLSVVQGDADNDLDAYPTGAFDYAILSQTLQATHRPDRVLESLARIGRHAIVSVPNFGHWRIRLQLLLGGRMPQSGLLAYDWWETPNIHLCTIRDFVDLTKSLGLQIEAARMLDHEGGPIPVSGAGRMANLLAEQGVFLLRGITGTQYLTPETGR
jgi:methionine biosynthesis protein MetW